MWNEEEEIGGKGRAQEGRDRYLKRRKDGTDMISDTHALSDPVEDDHHTWRNILFFLLDASLHLY